ncbi:unnamed protein product [Brassica napus]|nr:unnamed protein product [Brassica napus]
MSLFLSRLGVRRSSSVSLLLSKALSTNSLRRQTPPCSIMGAIPSENGLGRLEVAYANQRSVTDLDKMIPLELVFKEYDDEKTLTIGASHGWIATLKEDGILRLVDDLNPVASDANPKRIPLPPLDLSSAFCKPAGQSPEWTNIKIENPCFCSSSRVMFSDLEDTSSGHGTLAGSDDPKLHKVQFQNLTKLHMATRELMDSCFTIEHLVESRPTRETFLVKQYKKTAKNKEGVDIMKTEFLMVFKLDDEGNAVYTQDMGDLAMFLSMSEPFCVPASSFPGSMFRNNVIIYDYDEMGIVDVSDIPFYLHSVSGPHSVPYQIPPQDIEN